MKQLIKIQGMHCKSCKNLIEEILEEKGVKSQVSLTNNSANIEFEESKISLDDIKKIMKEENFDVD